MPAMQLGDQGVVGLEPAGVVLETDDGMKTIEEPGPSGSPRLPDQIGTGAPDPRRPRPVGSAGCQPPSVLTEEAMQRTEGAPQVERATLDRDDSLLHPTIIVVSGPERVWLET
jgi:hypothetical protein